MNTVILLNPNQNVRIKNTVKEILKKINLENFLLYINKINKFNYFTLYLIFSHSEAKNLKEEIQKITVKNAVLKDLKLFFPVEIILKNKSFSEKITYGTFKAKNGEPESLEKHEFSFEGFPMNIKSFRIAKFQKNEETFSWSFFDEIWCKIKN